jgi:hypothetical protein
VPSELREISRDGPVRIVFKGEVVAVTAAFLVLAASVAAPEALECPSIPDQTLVYIDVYDGPPENKADLVPDQHQNPSNKTAWNIWELYQNPERIYVQCGYGQRLEGPYSRTEFIMLPATAKTCRADFKIGPKSTDLALTKFACR